MSDRQRQLLALDVVQDADALTSNYQHPRFSWFVHTLVHVVPVLKESGAISSQKEQRTKSAGSALLAVDVVQNLQPLAIVLWQEADVGNAAFDVRNDLQKRATHRV